MFNNLSIKVKLLTGFIVVAIIAAVVGYIGMTNIKTIDDADTELYQKMTKPMGDLIEMATTFQRMRVNLRDAITATTPEAFNKFKNRFEELGVVFDQSATEYEKLLLTEAVKKLQKELNDNKQNYVRVSEQIMELAKAGKIAEAKELMAGDGFTANQKFQASLDTTQAVKLRLAKETARDNTELANEATNTMIIFVVIAVILAILIGWLIARNIQAIIQSIIKETRRLVDAAINGKLDTRGNPEQINFEFREIVIGLNKTLDAVIGPLNVAAEYIDRISKGDMPPQITDEYKGDFNEIKMNVNQCINAVQLLITDAGVLAKAAVEGKLDTRADASKHQGDFRKIVAGVNNTLDAVIGPLNVAAEYVDRISKGDIPPQITDNYNGDFNEIKMNLNQCITSVRLLVDDAAMLSKAAVEGKLDTRADATKHNGDFRKIVQGVNNTLDSVIEPLNVAAEYVDRISKGDIPPQITDNYNGDFNEIKMNLNQCISSVRLLVDDAGMLAKAAVEGKLDTRADATKHNGDFRKIVQGVNNTLDSVIGPLNVAAEYVDRISKGDIPPQITDNYNGDFNEIKMNLNQCITSVRLLVDDAVMLAQAAVEGKLDTRADASKHNGDFRKIVQGVNNTLDSVIGPLNVAAEYVDRISKGDIPPQITDNYNGDFNEIKMNLNQCITSVRLLVDDAGMLAKAAVDGKLDTRADASKHNGDFRKIVQGVNETLDSVIGPLNVAAEYIDRISIGDIPPKITDKYNGDFNTIINNINVLIEATNRVSDAATAIAKGDFNIELQPRSNNDNLIKSFINMIQNLQQMISQINVLANSAIVGRLDTRADASIHSGEYQNIINGINNTLDAIIKPLNVSAEYMDRIAKGDIPPKITDEYKGDFNEIKNNLNQCIDAVASLTRDSKLLANSAVAGDLKTRAEAIKHNGDFRNIINGVNETLDAITKPMNDAANILAVMATGDLTSKMNGEYKGDYQILKTNINTVLDSLNNLITQITYAVDQVSEASFEISSTADTIAAASEEQSSQADEVANAVEVMSKTITENAMAAGKTAKEAENNGRIAKEGGEVVAQTVSKMKDIANVVKKSAENIEKLGESSKQIGEIISVIDDIADQTNLLALNAAIEAARAGEQGRGFAVVADEVRKLAERTTEATKQIASMIKGIQSETEEAVVAMKRGNEEVTSGIALADRAGSALQQILVSTQDLQMMISKIASASEEQSSTSEEIAKNVNSISIVTNDSTKRIQEIAKSSEEMAKLTGNLKELVKQFKTEDSLNLQQIGSRSIKGNAGRHLQARN